MLWLWHRPATVAPIQPLAWEPPYAAGAAQEIATTTTTKKKNLQVSRKREIIKIIKEINKIEIKETIEEFLLWCNRIGSISGALGHRFDPWPSTVG